MERIDSIDYGQILKMTKEKGTLTYEFQRCTDKIMDNMVDVWRYDSKKKSKGKSTWVTVKDFPKYVDLLLSDGFTDVRWETK